MIHNEKIRLNNDRFRNDPDEIKNIFKKFKIDRGKIIIKIRIIILYNLYF